MGKKSTDSVLISDYARNSIISTSKGFRSLNDAANDARLQMYNLKIILDSLESSKNDAIKKRHMNILNWWSNR